MAYKNLIYNKQIYINPDSLNEYIELNPSFRKRPILDKFKNINRIKF